MSFGALIKKSRISVGLSQVSLAAASGVSLPTIQNIERGKANPSASTLEALGKELGLELALVPATVDWSYLINAGLPLTMSAPRPRTLPNAQQVLRELRKLPRTSLTDRERMAAAGMLLAIECHYVSFAKRLGSSILDAFRDSFSEPEVLKLKRLAKARLADWL